MFESNDKGLNSLMWNRFKSLCRNVCSAVRCHLGAGWTGLNLLSCVLAPGVGVQSTLVVFRGTGCLVEQKLGVCY